MRAFGFLQCLPLVIRLNFRLFFQFHVVCNYTFGSVFISAFFSDLPWRVEKKLMLGWHLEVFRPPADYSDFFFFFLMICFLSGIVKSKIWNVLSCKTFSSLLFLNLLILYVKANSFHLRDLKATPTTYMISRSFFLRIISNSVEQNRTDVCNYFNYILMKVFNSDQMHNFL